MRLGRFRIQRFRNIHDSGWVELEALTAIVGQNECGKSNLLRGLHLLNPFDDSKYQLDADWPIDLWGKQSAQQVVCEAEFILSAEEIQQFIAAIGWEAVKVPSELTATVTRNYDNNYGVVFSDEDFEELDGALDWIVSHLPRCVYMDDYATFNGHTDLPSLVARCDATEFGQLDEADQTILMALGLAELDPKALVAKEQTEGGRTLRGFDSNAASRHLSQQFHGKWKQKKVKFSIRVDGPTLDIHVEDEGLDAFVPLKARSRGFQWFISFIWRFTYASRGEFENCILLLDEPGVHLHHEGHGDLLKYFEELSDDNTTIYTTHLATLLDPGYPERVRIMEVYDHHARVNNSAISKQRQPMMVIEAALGLTGNMAGLLGSRQNLIVEGGDDVMILNKLSSLLRRSGGDGISDRIYLLPAQGASKTPMFASFIVGNGWDGGVLLDSDMAGEQARKKIEDTLLKDLAEEQRSAFRVLMLGKATGSSNNEFAIEDLFPEQFYLDCVNEAYSANLEVSELSVEGSDQIVKRVDVALKAKGRGNLDKQRVMKAMQGRFNTMRSADDLPDGTSKLAKKLFDKINKTFE